MYGHRARGREPQSTGTGTRGPALYRGPVFLTGGGSDISSSVANFTSAQFLQALLVLGFLGGRDECPFSRVVKTSVTGVRNFLDVVSGLC